MTLTSIPGIWLAILLYTYREFERSHRIYGVIIEQLLPCILSPVLQKDMECDSCGMELFLLFNHRFPTRILNNQQILYIYIWNFVSYSLTYS